MLSALLKPDSPLPVADDPATRQTEKEWKAAQAAVERLRPRYERLKLLVNQPANATLDDLGATSTEQDQAFGIFPDVARQYHECNEAERRARAARDGTHGRAYAARQAWYAERLREKERALVELIVGAIYDLVQEIHDLTDDAGLEGVRVEPTAFPPVPLRIGNSCQGGLEAVIHDLERLVKSS